MSAQDQCHCGAEAEISGMCAPCKYSAHDTCRCSRPPGDVATRAKAALDGITPGTRRADDLDVYALESLPDHGHRIHTVAACRTPADARFDAAAPELIRELVETLTEARAWASWFAAARDQLRTIAEEWSDWGPRATPKLVDALLSALDGES